MPNKTVLLISGSLRDRSTNTAALRTAVTLCPTGWQATLYAGMRDLPHFDPDIEATALPATVAELRSSIDKADAVLICTPEYAGDLPGSFKNLLDWTVGGMEIVGKPTAWVNVSGSPTEARGAHAALRVVLTYTGAAIAEDACQHLPVGRADLSDDGLVTKASVVQGLRTSLDRLAAQASELA